MSEESMIEINSEFMEQVKEIINAFSWDDDAENEALRLNYFKSQIEKITGDEETKRIDFYDFFNIFGKTCHFEFLHYQDLDDTPDLLARFLSRVDVSLQNTEHKDFRSSGEMGIDLYNMRSILNKYDIELWLLFDEKLAITRLEDAEFVEEWCGESGLYNPGSGELILRPVTDIFSI